MAYLAITLPGGQTMTPNAIPNGGLPLLAKIFGNVITIFMMVGLMFVVISMVWGAVQWISSGGDKAKLTAGRNRITTALIGFILLLLSFFAINAVGYLFKVDVLKF
jgi:hypothetical protein